MNGASARRRTDMATSTEPLPAEGSPRNRPGVRGARVWRWLAAVLLLVVAAVALAEWAQWPFLRHPLERIASNALGRQVTLQGEFGLRLLGSVRLRSSLLHIAQPADRRERVAEPFLELAGLSVVIPYRTLLGLARGSAEPIAVDTFWVRRMRANLVRERDGTANWQMSAGAIEDDDAQRAPMLPTVDRLVVEEGHVRVEDEVLDLDLALDLRTDESSREQAPASPGLRVEGKGTYKDSPLRLMVTSAGALRAAEGATRQGGSVTLQARVHLASTELRFNGTAGDFPRLGLIRGSFSLSGPSLGETGRLIGVTLPTTAPYRSEGSLAREGEVWTVKLDRLEVGSSRLDGSFRFDARPKVPLLEGKLGGARLALGDLGPALGAPPPHDAGDRARATAAPRPRAAGTRVLPQREFDIPSLAALNADVAVAIGELALGTKQLETLTDLRTRIVLKDSVLQLRDLSVATAAGRARGELEVDARAKLPRWSARLSWSDIRLERFVKARSPVGSKKGGRPLPVLSGDLEGRLRVKGSGRSTAQVLASLDGDLELRIGQGRVSHLVLEFAGIDVAQSLGVAIGGDRLLHMRCAVATFDIRDGVLQARHVLVDTSDSTVVAGGRVSLADETLDLIVTARPKDFSPLSLRAPIGVGGTFAQPRVGIEGTKLALRLGAAALLAAAAPIAALIALVDTGDPDIATCRKTLLRPPSEANGAASRPGDKVDHAPRADPASDPAIERRRRAEHRRRAAEAQRGSSDTVDRAPRADPSQDPALERGRERRLP